jgi:hypothetical protein
MFSGIGKQGRPIEKASAIKGTRKIHQMVDISGDAFRQADRQVYKRSFSMLFLAHGRASPLDFDLQRHLLGSPLLGLTFYCACFQPAPDIILPCALPVKLA